MRAIQAHAFLEVAVAGEEFESLVDEGFWIQGDEIGLAAVDALVVSGEVCKGAPGRSAQSRLLGVAGDWGTNDSRKRLSCAPTDGELVRSINHFLRRGDKDKV